MSLSVAQSVIIIQLPSLLLPVSVAPELSVRQLDPAAHNERMVISYNHGNEYANIITLIGSYSFLCSHSTENSELLIEKQRN